MAMAGRKEEAIAAQIERRHPEQLNAEVNGLNRVAAAILRRQARLTQLCSANRDVELYLEQIPDGGRSIRELPALVKCSAFCMR